MTSHHIRLLAITPVLLTAMATSALAQEAVISNAAVALEDQVIAASVQTETVVFPLQISVTTAGMYVFTSPAHNPVKVTLDGEVIMTNQSRKSIDGFGQEWGVFSLPIVQGCIPFCLPKRGA